MKKVYANLAITLIFTSFFSCTTKRYEEEIDGCLSRIEDSTMYHRPLTRGLSVTSCINGNVEEIEKIIIKSKYKYTQNFPEYSQRYQKVLHKYFNTAFSEIRGKLNVRNNATGISYKDCLHYPPEYRVDLLQLTYSKMRYYAIAEEIDEIYSIKITMGMWHYWFDNKRHYYPSMDGIEQCRKEIIEHLKDDRFFLNEEYKQNNGDYLKQKECADTIEKLNGMINKLKNHMTYPSIIYS